MALGVGDSFWSNVIAAVVAAFTGAGVVIGFIWRLIWRVDSLETIARNQRKDFDDAELRAADLKSNVVKLHEEHYRLREMLASQPTKQDMIGLETRLGTQLDRIVQRIDTIAAK